MKTGKPLILTARISQDDLEPFDRLRKAHFPPDRNFLRAHLTMFHRLPGECEDDIRRHLEDVAGRTGTFMAQVSTVRHLGAGVAFAINSVTLQDIRAALKTGFASWLGSQDMQKWQPHITIQNKASRPKADALYRQLSHGFAPHGIRVEGLDLWEYLDGPWQHLRGVSFKSAV